jgi:RNase P subunit RPR2
MKRTALKSMSARAREESKVWKEVVRRRVQALNDKFGFLICEHCGWPITEGSQLDGHHNDHNRRNNTFENCRICHPGCNRYAIEDGNVKDVPSLL